MISSKHLVIAAIISIGVIFVIEIYGREIRMHPAHEKMREAAVLSEQWMMVIDSVVVARGLPIEPGLAAHHRGVIGIGYSPITTTLGVLEAKELSTNPNFAALIVRYLYDAGIDSSHTVGVTQSGSFPALAISTISALQTLGIKGVIISSLGSSSYGANRPEMTWLDMEAILLSNGMRYRTSMTTLGAEGDSGAGLYENGAELLFEAGRRNSVSVSVPKTFQDAIQSRMKLLDSAHIALLINIGGSHAVLGNCPHGESIPNGFLPSISSCSDAERGMLVRISEQGIPVIHLLNLRSLSNEYGFTSNTLSNSGIVFSRIEYDTIVVICSLSIVFGVIIFLSINRRMKDQIFFR